MDVSVVLATYNRSASLRETLCTFEGLACPPTLRWELLVVDNNSTDETKQVIQEFTRTARFPLRYFFEQKQGRSAALNTGIAASTGEIIAFTDDDVLIHPDWIANLKSTFDVSDAAAVAGRVVPLWTCPKPYWLEMDDQLAIVRFELGEELKAITIPPLGANSAFRREMFSKYGLFRLDLGVNGEKHTITCDDTEFGQRLINGEEKIIYAPGAIVYHPVDPRRMTKDYFLSWYYYNGRSVTRTSGLPDHGTFCFGVPRWFYRDLGANLLNWLFCFDSRHRFENKLRAYRSAGNIVEAHRLSHVKVSSAGATNCDNPVGEHLRT